MHSKKDCLKSTICNINLANWQSCGCRRLSEEESAVSKQALETVEPDSAAIQRIMEAFVQQPAAIMPPAPALAPSLAGKETSAQEGGAPCVPGSCSWASYRPSDTKVARLIA